MQPLVNVVSAHRQRNRAPRLPSNSQLLAARQQQAGAMNIGDGQDRPTGLAVGPATEHSDPWQLHFYDPSTRDVIERAKQFSHCDSASIDPFPIRASFNTKAVEYIDEAIAERRARGLIITDGKFCILTVVFVQLIGIFRLVATPFIEHYKTCMYL